MELLAPVNANTLDAALEAGADAVYFGLRRLNARRGAMNFSPEELSAVVEKIHRRGAKAHLTLNIDLTQRELGLALRTLELARQCGVDAVILRDPALLPLSAEFPQLQFHVSTQAGVSSSAGVRMARELGCHRVVLARELSREEIAACAAVPEMELEVFVQGALCFCASGRCLLSSWVGGRSGNRGACASPCRVGWRRDLPEAPEHHPLSTKDLCLLEKIPELQKMGVDSLKIEGRLKAAPWVSQAVTLYRNALDAKRPLEELRKEADALGGYTGRTLTQGYYEGHREGLTDQLQGRTRGAATATTTAGTTAAAAAIAATAAAAPACTAGTESAAGSSSSEEPEGLSVSIARDEQGGVLFQCRFNGVRESFRIPPQRIPNPRRALPLSQMVQDAADALPESAAQIGLPEELRGLLLPRRFQDAILQNLQDFLRKASREDDGVVRIPLPKALQGLLNQAPPKDSPNRLPLGAPADFLRLTPEQLPALPRHQSNPLPRLLVAVTSHHSPEALEKALGALPKKQAEEAVLALPAVCYEEDLEGLSALLDWAKDRGLSAEANSWDTLWLCRKAQIPFATGQGMAVLNNLAAQTLARLGAQWCALSWEMDRRQIRELTAACAVPLSLTLFSYPTLMTTRAVLPPEFPEGETLLDARKCRLVPHKQGQLTLLRAQTPMDWRTLRDPIIRVAHLELDLTGLPTNTATPPAPEKTPFLFNFDRTLR